MGKTYFKTEANSNNEIENSLNGLYNYLTAPNIRNKVKHLIFISMRFTECFEIYGNNSFDKLTVNFIK